MIPVKKSAPLMMVRIEPHVEPVVRKNAKRTGRCLQKEVNISLSIFYSGKPKNETP